MSNRRHIIYDRSLSEYAYREIRDADATKRSNLSHKEHKIIMNDTSISKFAHEAPLDHLLTILTKIGKVWDLRIYDEAKEEEADQLEFNVVNQFQFPEKRLDLINATVRNGIHYLSSHDVMLSAHMCSQNVHSNVYALSANSRDAVKRVSAIKTTKLPFSTQIAQAKEAWDTLNQIMLNQLNALSWAQDTLGLQQADIRILCALFRKRDSAMTMKEIAAATTMEDSPASLKKTTDKLLKEGLIMTDEKHGPKVQVHKGNKMPKRSYYMISTAGIDKVMKYSNHIHSVTFNPK